MQNKYFKSAIISSAIAVTTGVVLFGINATFGAPTYQPPGADVSPTFTGLNVTGPIANSGGEVTINDTDGLNVSKGNLSVSGTGYFDKLAITKEITAGGAIWAQDGIDATQGTGTVAAKTVTASTAVLATSVATGGLEVTGDIKNSYNQPVTINDPEGLNIAAGDLDVKAGGIKNSTGFLLLNSPIDVRGNIRDTTAAPVIINDSNGVRIDAGDLDVKAGGIKNSTGFLLLNSPIDVRGNIRDTTAAPVIINDSNGVRIDAGDLDLQAGGIKNTTAFNDGDLKIDDDLDIMGNTDVSGETTLNKGLSVQDSLTVNPDGSIDKPITLNGSTLVKFALTAGGWLDVQTGIKSSTGSVVINDGVAVTGKVTATEGFGTYTFRQSAFVLVPKGGANHAYATLACNADEVIVSCFSNAFSSNAGANFWTNENFDDVILTALYPWTTKCEANYKNTSAVADKYIKVGAMCFNPKL